MSQVADFTIKLLAGGTLLLLITIASKIIYNLYFHPLASFPGPKLAAITDLWYAKQYWTGKWPINLGHLHEKYGEVVRVGVNELSFCTVQAQKDMYGHVKQGKPQFLKSEWYDRPGETAGLPTIRDPIVHRETRRALSHAFSAAALREQTDIAYFYLDMFISQVEKYGTGPKGIDMSQWFNYITFDIIGDLAFGESFNATKNAKSHSWITLIMESSFVLGLGALFRRLPVLVLFKQFMFKDPAFFSKRIEFMEITMDLIKKRLANDEANERMDFFAHILKGKNQEDNMTYLKGNAAAFIIAGSETTATTLSALAYYVLKYPETMKRLTKEVREAFKSVDEITAEATSALPYVHAVVEETLRIYPAISVTLPRISPGATVAGHYVPAGAIATTAPFALSHSPKYWHEPNEFHPERWLPAAHPLYDPVFSKDNKDASKPFSSGPRVCIGINLAYLELHLIVARMIWHFDWEAVNKDLDWLEKSEVYLFWIKPELFVRFTPVVRDTKVEA